MTDRLNRLVRDEWSALPVSDSPRDEAAGILSGMQRERCDGGYLFSSPRIFAVRRLMRLWSVCGADDGGGISLVRSQQGRRVAFVVESAAAESLFSVTDGIAKRARNWDWVRGIFGSCGSLYVPKSGYFLLLRAPFAGDSDDRVLAILKSCGFSVGVRKKADCSELTLRDRDRIVTFLSRIGLVKSVLNLEETAIFRSMRDRANRLVNCDAANINKSVSASRRQLDLIRDLERFGIVETLPRALFDLVAARKKHQSVSLKELGQILPTPISKSTVEYRWRKLEERLRNHLKGDEANVLRKGGR
ncbi:MAG: DNA-binding protein WhiA [Synergistes sp.]|nr:DNA-binding protein WhiA [Synergistes sp.]